MSSPLKPVNPIRLKWATFSQHTRELERRHMWFFFFFFPLSCQLLHLSPQPSSGAAALATQESPLSKGQRMQDTACWTTEACPASKKGKATAGLLSTSMFQSSSPGNCQICHGFALPWCKNDNSVWFVSYLTHRHWAGRCEWSVHPQEGRTLLCLKHKLWSGCCWKALSGLQRDQKSSRNLRKPFNLPGQICGDRGKN